MDKWKEIYAFISDPKGFLAQKKPEHRRTGAAKAARAAHAREDIATRAIMLAERQQARSPSGADVQRRRKPIFDENAVHTAIWTFRWREGKGGTPEDIADEMVSGRHLIVSSHHRQKTRGPVDPLTGQARARWRDPIPAGIPELAPISENSELVWRPDERGDLG